MNIKNKKIKEVYYICPSCGELSTFSQQLEDCSSGGLPYGYCEFNNGRIFIGYKRISKELWDELNKYKAGKLRLKEYLKYKVNKLRGKNVRHKSKIKNK